MYRRRVRHLFILLAVPFALVAGRLFHLQVVHGATARTGPAGPRMETSLVDVERGSIVDRNGRVLAADEVGYDLCVNYLYISPDGERLKRELKRRTPADKRRSAEAR